MRSGAKKATLPRYSGNAPGAANPSPRRFPVFAGSGAEGFYKSRQQQAAGTGLNEVLDGLTGASRIPGLFIAFEVSVSEAHRDP